MNLVHRRSRVDLTKWSRLRNGAVYYSPFGVGPNVKVGSLYKIATNNPNGVSVIAANPPVLRISKFVMDSQRSP